MPPTAPRRIQLEVPVATVDDAVAARDGGADRLELCSALAFGGLTPSLGTLLEVLHAVDLPVLPLLRPRPGGFHYSANEFRTLCADLDLTLAHGAAGVVTGVLRADGTVDEARCREVIRLANGRPVAFHRAFDVTPDPIRAFDTILDLGFARILSSGQSGTAREGAVLLGRLVERAGARSAILAGGGIRSENVVEVVRRTGCDQVHASLRVRRYDLSVMARPEVSFGGATQGKEAGYDATCFALVKQMVSLLRETTHTASVADR